MALADYFDFHGGPPLDGLAYYDLVLGMIEILTVAVLYVCVPPIAAVIDLWDTAILMHTPAASTNCATA